MNTGGLSIHPAAFAAVILFLGLVGTIVVVHKVSMWTER